MKKFLTLIEIEFRNLVFILVGFFFAMTGITGLLFFSGASSANSHALRMMNQGDLSASQFTAANGYFTLSAITNNILLYVVFIFFFFAMIAAISFWIWQREWAGKSKGIYFLLSLRAPRLRILASKLLVVVITSWLFFGMVLINLAIGSLIMNIVFTRGLVGSNLISSFLQNAHWLLALAVPASFLHFIYHTLFTIAIFLAMTAWVLLTKSFKWLGGIIGFIYCLSTLIIYIITQSMWLFYDERILVEWAFVLGSCLISFVLNYWLINKKISV